MRHGRNAPAPLPARALAAALAQALILALALVSTSVLTAVLTSAQALAAARAPAATAPAPAAGRGASALRIYASESKPVAFRDGARLDGLVVELARMLQQRLGRDDPVELAPWARQTALARAEPNVLLLALVPTAEREQYLSFVGPVFVAYISAFAVKGRGAELRALGDGMRLLRVGARRGSIFAELARRAGYTQIDELNSSESAARMLLLHRVDLWFDGEAIAAATLRDAGLEADAVEPVFRLATQQVYFAFSHGTPEATMRAWQQALLDSRRDGSFQRIYQKWLPGYPLPALPAELAPAG